MSSIKIMSLARDIWVSKENIIKKGEDVLLLGEIENMKEHYAFSYEGNIYYGYYGYHIDNFKECEESIKVVISEEDYDKNE